MRNAAALLALATLIAAAEPAAQGTHTDKHLGYKLKAPPGWAYLGPDGDLGSAVAVFGAERDYAPKTARGAPHTPVLRVLLLPKAGAARPAEAEKLPMLTPYRGFADYLGRVQGGAVEKSSEVAKVGKLTGIETVAEVRREAGNLTLHSFRTDLDQGELVLELEVLSEQYAKLKSDFEKSLKTLSLVAPSAADAVAAPEPAPWKADPAGWRKLPAEARHEQREKLGEEWRAARLKAREPGFKTTKIGPYVILSRADGKFTKRVAEVAAAGRAWVEGRFAAVSDEAVMPAVIRVFADQREHDAYRLREAQPMPYHSGRREIYYFEDRRFGNTGEGFGLLLRGVLLHYLDDKDPGIIDNLPRWLDYGMSEFMRSTRCKGRKIEFVSSDHENARLKWYPQNKQDVLALWLLIQETDHRMVAPKDGSAEETWGFPTECSRLLRWLDAGGNALLKQPDFVLSYFKAIGTAAQTAPPDPGKDVDWLRLTDEQTKELRKQVYQRRDAFLIQVNDAVCGLDVPTWNKANEHWRAFNASFKQ